MAAKLRQLGGRRGTCSSRPRRILGGCCHAAGECSWEAESLEAKHGPYWRLEGKLLDPREALEVQAALGPHEGDIGVLSKCLRVGLVVRKLNCND